eukprot:481166-Prorocentrum_minimum.AAC.2
MKDSSPPWVLKTAKHSELPLPSLSVLVRPAGGECRMGVFRRLPSPRTPAARMLQCVLLLLCTQCLRADLHAHAQQEVLTSVSALVDGPPDDVAATAHATPTSDQSCAFHTFELDQLLDRDDPGGSSETPHNASACGGGGPSRNTRVYSPWLLPGEKCGASTQQPNENADVYVQYTGI